MIRAYKDKTPQFDETVFIEDSAQVIGDVVIGPHSSIWFNTTVRGDVHYIRIGSYSNVQDNSVIHVTNGRFPTILEDYVTVGHSVTLHGCHIKSNCLIGIGSIVMDDVVIEEYSLIAAGALVSPGTKVSSAKPDDGFPGETCAGCYATRKWRESAIMPIIISSTRKRTKKCTADKAMIQAVKGTRDIFRRKSANGNLWSDAAREFAPLYGYEEIRTPIFESTELFARGIGEVTDIVKKQMFTFPMAKTASRSPCDRRIQHPSVRAFVEQGFDHEPAVTKWYYLGPMFRYERPQKGRYRQFSQWGIEVLGTENPAVDAEVIEVVNAVPESCGLQEVELQLNSVGCAACRPQYTAALPGNLAEAERQNVQRIARIGSRGILFECWIAKWRRISRSSMHCPRIDEYLCEDCNTHFKDVQKFLDFPESRSFETNGWFAASITTPRPRSKLLPADWVLKIRSPGADAMMDLWKNWEASRPKQSVSRSVWIG